jgi:hypothetical protein
LTDAHTFDGADAPQHSETLVPLLRRALERLVADAPPDARTFIPVPYRKHDLAGAYKGSVVDSIVTALLAERGA